MRRTGEKTQEGEMKESGRQKAVKNMLIKQFQVPTKTAIARTLSDMPALTYTTCARLLINIMSNTTCFVSRRMSSHMSSSRGLRLSAYRLLFKHGIVRKSFEHGSTYGRCRARLVERPQSNRMQSELIRTPNNGISEEAQPVALSSASSWRS